jgi:hypothetical protein
MKRQTLQKKDMDIKPDSFFHNTKLRGLTAQLLKYIFLCKLFTSDAFCNRRVRQGNVTTQRLESSTKAQNCDFRTTQALSPTYSNSAVSYGPGSESIAIHNLHMEGIFCIAS